MRLELEFDEHEYRYVCLHIHDMLLTQEQKTVRSWGNHIKSSFLAFLIFSLLGFLNEGWFNFSVLSLIYGNIFLIKIFYLKYNNRRLIKDDNNNLEIGIDNLKLIETAYIDFDENAIRYFENGNLEINKSWSDIKKFINEEEFLMFIFDLYDHNEILLIPKKMTDEKIFELFRNQFLKQIKL